MSETLSTTIIVGAGQAGSDAAVALRQKQYVGRIVLIGEETYLPYRRPPLSKGFLAGEMVLESLYLKPAAFYEKHAIEFLPGQRVEAIEREDHQLRLGDGRLLAYDKLILATGGRPRRLELPGAEAANLHYVRTVADILRLKEQFLAGRRLLIVGGGYIGLEAAAVGIKLGLNVTLIEALPRVLARVTAPELSAFYQRVHRAEGVDLRTGVELQALEGEGRIEKVRLSDGSTLQTDLLVVGVGLLPSTELAEAAGLAVDNGILVDAQTRTSDSDIHAIGDCSNHENTFYQRRMRLESVPNATEQARVAAAVICGEEAEHAAVPWFWSDQYDLKLQMVGLSQGYERLILRGDPESRAFIALYLKSDILIAADAVNSPADFALAKRLVSERRLLDTARLGDPGASLKNFL